MKKKLLKKKLEISMKALRQYRGFMINGYLFADKALDEIDAIKNEETTIHLSKETQSELGKLWHSIEVSGEKIEIANRALSQIRNHSGIPEIIADEAYKKIQAIK